MNVRTRFAPSPTGFMHVGNVRTALFAWLYARQQKGEFLLRIEDTDRKRYNEAAEQHIFDALEWLDIDIDTGGPNEPIRQSERLVVYRQFAQGLINSGLAYADPYTPQEVNEFREQAKRQKRPFLFREHRPETLECPDDWYGNVSLRFKIPEIKRYQWEDVVRGTMSAGEDALDDFVIMKSDGFPTYNFAHIIDDHEMQITHVIRGEEFIASMPKFLALYEALGMERPVFATAPPILSAQGGKKLSKREGAKDVLDYRQDGYLPQAVMNFLASLGWNDGTEKEVFSKDELIQAFSLERIQKSGARFDETKLDWLNWQHFSKNAAQNYKERVAQDSEKSELLKNMPADYDQAIQLAIEKSSSVTGFDEQMCLFYDPQPFKLTQESLKQVDKDLDIPTAQKYLEATAKALRETDFNAQTLEETLRELLEELQATPRGLLNLVRWTISGQKVSPNLFATMEVLGKQESLRRLQSTLQSAG